MSFRGIFDPDLPIPGMFDNVIFDTENKLVQERTVITAFVHGNEVQTTSAHGNEVITVK